jgi:hypothetical protein
VKPALPMNEDHRVSLKSSSMKLACHVSSKGFYHSMARYGLHYGPRFAMLENTVASTTESFAQAASD